ncbi:MAG: efflux RND transporter periplasmic adaptor subunit [Phycisphaerales bacterium]|nr:efflux RND transporter periplasmic adaptor subunit [Phycisphaerales bacterium]
MNIQRLLLLSVLTPFLFALNGCGNGRDTGNTQHQEDDGHGHAESGGHDDHGDEDGEDEHDGEVVQLPNAQLRAAGVIIQPLAGGKIATYIMLPAEIGLNQDTVLHVTPRVPGIVTQVNGYLGHDVKAGDLLAVLESPELGETKITYLQAIQAKIIADAEHERQITISKNTAILLDILRENPNPDTLRNHADTLRIGANKGRLLSTYARMKAGAANYAREKELDTKGISTQVDLLASQEMYYSAQAEYMAAFEDIDFSFRVTMQQAMHASMIALSGVENAERRLHLLGLTDEQVRQVATEPDMNVARYELRAPVNGQIISKHITPGEKVDSEASVYTIADLSTVWLNISIYSQYAEVIEEGQHVTVLVGDRTASGVVDYISSIVSESSRTVAARVVLENADGSWKPGVFVTVRVETQKSHADRIVPIGAIQTYEGHSVVFIQDADGIEPVQVTLGRKNDVSVELIGNDVAIGTPIVVKNSFLMKAELGKGSAGHEH